MTDWQRAWRYVTKPSKRRTKAKIRRLNHRKNRLVAKSLDNIYFRLDAYEVN
jgi:hypothetical protein